MFESFEPGKTEKAKCPKKRRREEEEKKNSTLPKTMPQAAGKNHFVNILPNSLPVIGPGRACRLSHSWTHKKSL